jgi:hypothetical protein
MENSSEIPRRLISPVMEKNKCAPTSRIRPLVKYRRSTTAQPDCQALWAGRRSPTALRAAVPVRLDPGSRHSRCRIANQRLWLAEGVLWSADLLAWTSRIAARQAQGKTSRGAGGRLGNAAQRAGAVHGRARERRWRQHNAGFGAAYGLSETRQRWLRFVRILRRRTPIGPDFQHAEIMSVSCPDGMSDKGGLGGFRAQLRHANAWRVAPGNCQARTPQGSRCEAARGWFPAEF